MRTIPISLAAVVLWGLAAPAAASSRYVSDPRVELLGVVQYLSGARPARPLDEAYRLAVEAYFAPYRGHPAVARWREGLKAASSMMIPAAKADDAGEDGRGVAILYFTDPPELATRPGKKPPHPRDAAEAARWRSLLAALRDFAKKSDFMRFYAERRSDYKRVGAAVAAQFGVKDPLDAVQRYVGLPLQTDARWIVSPLFVPGGRDADIMPYPDPSALPDPGKEDFEATTLVPAQESSATPRSRPELWREPLSVFLGPALSAFDEARGGAPGAYYGPTVAACRVRGSDCAKDWLAAALSARLDAAAFGASAGPRDTGDARRDEYAAALAERLEEYEKDRRKWRTLWDFMPRLMSVFPEKAGLKTDSAPSLPPVKRVKDLFPAFRRRAR